MSGFFGKIPSHGDFITRGLARTFLDTWDGWLQSCIAESRAQLGEGWLNTYLTSPIWRFALVPGICGSDAWAGIVMPSVDRVGRYFPLTIAASLPADVRPLQLPGSADAWYEAVELLALRTLDDDAFDANALQEALGAVGEIDVGAVRSEVSSSPGAAWSLVLLGSSGANVAPAIAHALVTRHAPSYSLWWTLGAEGAAPPAALLVPNLPEPRSFVDLLHGAWSEVGVSLGTADTAAAASSRGATAS